MRTSPDRTSATAGGYYRWVRVAGMIALGGVVVCACAGGAPEVDIEPGVPLDLAEARAAAIHDLRYDVRFALPASRSEAIEGHVTATFTWEGTGPVVFDFAAQPEHVHAVRVGGSPVEPDLRNEHLIVPVPGGTGPVTVEVDFTAGDGSLNRQDDFLYTLFVPDRARVAFPLFDQPDLKARFRLQLDVPAGWRAVANGSLASREDGGDRALLTFTETDPISSYLFAFAAGEFEVEEAERDGRRMAMYHRETDLDRVERNAGAVFDLHASALAWLEEYTGIPFPFEKFDFVLVPAFQYGGMEHPGAIFYRADAMLLDESATQNAYLGRASLIAHETAHMWFGDLVTMTWFSDVWMKETFANFLAAKIVNPAFPNVNHELRFLLAHHPAAYGVDRTAGANPIRQPLDNLNEAGTLYGAIIYQKAPIVFAHLERLIGETALRDGLREYLAAHSYGNAGWADLIAILDSRTAEDLAAWSRTWVEESGRPRVGVRLESDGATIERLAVQQADPAEAGRLWNQRLDLRLGYAGEPPETLEVHLRDPEAVVAEAVGRPAPDYVLANGGGLGYGLMALDPRTRDYLLAELPSIDDPLTRAIGWVSLWELLLEGEVDAEALIDLARRALPAETDEQNISRGLGYLTSAYWRYLTPERRTALAPEIEVLLWRGTTEADSRSLAAAWFGAYRNVALSADAVARLERIWREEEAVPGLPLAERDFTALAQGLAVRGVVSSAEILAAERDGIDNPDRRAAFEFVMPALSGERAARDAFFESLGDPANRAREPWVLTALGFLHHPLRARESEPYIRPSLDLLEEIQRTGDIFFPLRWLDATLGGHQSAGAAAIVEQYLADRPDLPPRLRAKVLQAADGLLRAASIVDTPR
ncbi:MAG: aminopeptidase [Acidobacteria bacterium]|nr:aminopeptidase [Acidobacteriota bacterium]MYJ04389.1 aminopeptidase [Acidobacteriota bacterium]